MKNENKKRVSILTLGCSKNVVDSETILSRLRNFGISYTENIEEAETLIINTCGFINSAKEESIQVIMEASELKAQGKIKKLIVTGCLNERYMKDLERQLEYVDHFFGVNAEEQIAQVLTNGSYRIKSPVAQFSVIEPQTRDSRKLSSQNINIKSDKHTILKSHNLKKELLGERFATMPRMLTPQHYAYIKISEGCDHPCSFCAIPLMRGSHISRSQEDILGEISALASYGTKEFLLIAQDSTYYGKDLYGKKNLPQLLSKIADIPGVEWIRIMYAYPTSFPFELLDVISERDNICKYIDIPFQHVSNSILKSMRRGITRQRIEELIDKIRGTIPNAAIRSTFIVGYPGESEKDFKELLDFIRTVELDRVGVFTYSSEEGTYSRSFGDPISSELKNERQARLMKAQMKINWKKNLSKIGKTMKVLVDEQRKGIFIGRTEHDAPDIDNTVIIESENTCKVGEYANILITKASEYDLYGKPMNTGK